MNTSGWDWTGLYWETGYMHRRRRSHYSSPGCNLLPVAHSVAIGMALQSLSHAELHLCTGFGVAVYEHGFGQVSREFKVGSPLLFRSLRHNAPLVKIAGLALRFVRDAYSQLTDL